MKGSRVLRGKRVACLIPSMDIARLHALTGEPNMTSIAIENTPKDAAALIAVILRGLEPGNDRREALRIASSLSSGNRLPSVPMAALLPEDASVEQLSQLWNGLMLMLLALGSSSSDTSVGTVVANAASMASGSPFASDPLVGERQNEVVLAKAILEAALLDDEHAKQWFADNGLAEALKSIVMTAPGGSTDADPRTQDAVDKIAEMYDCWVHDQPLGGDALNGSAFKDFVSEAWSGLKKATTSAVGAMEDKMRHNAAIALDRYSKRLRDVESSNASGGGRDQKSESGGGSQGIGSSSGSNSSAEDAARQAAANVSESVSSGVAQAKAALNEAKEALESGKENIATYQEKLRQTALQNAKLQWAQAFLDAPDEVSTILAAATPNLSDPASFIQSMLATLPAAKATGNLGTIRALLYALKSAAQKGDGSADTLYSLISGDVMLAQLNKDEAVGQTGVTSSLGMKLRAQKDYLRAASSELLEEASERAGANEKGGA